MIRDLAYEPDVVVVDDVETTTQKVDGQNDRQLVAETNVTHHTKTEALTDMVVTPHGDTEVMEGFIQGILIVLCSTDLSIMWH